MAACFENLVNGMLLAQNSRTIEKIGFAVMLWICAGEYSSNLGLVASCSNRLFLFSVGLLSEC
jgi:hypothetical protein